jgi:hypothetical protein
MKRFAVVLWLLCLVSIPLPAQSARYMWCWNNTAITNNTGSARSDFYSFCTAPFGNPSKAVKHLFYYAHTDISSNQANLRSFLSDAHSKGFKVIFLDGDAAWVTSSALRVYGESIMDSLISFNAGGTVTQRFDGVQYDVEPYGATGWSTNSETFWATFTTLLQNCQNKTNAYNTTYSPNSIYFEVAIPRWYDTDASPVTSSTQCQDICDSVAMMDYVDTATPLVNDAIGEINYADSIGKKVVVGVETQNVGYDATSFYEEYNAYMESVLTTAETTFKTHASYQGIAIHYYTSYIAMAAAPVELSDFNATNGGAE